MSIPGLMDRAASEFRQDNLTHAEALYSAVIQQDPRNAKAYSNRSAVHLKAQEYQKALADAQHCTRIDPGFAKGWGRLAAAYHGLKHYEDAISAYKRASELEPTNASYTESIAEMQKLVGEKRGIASDDTREAFYFRRSVDGAVAAMKEGKNDDAVRLFTKAIQQTSAAAKELHVLYANRSAAYLKLGDVPNAIDDAVAATRENATYARGFVRLAAARLADGDISEAERAANMAIKLDGSNAAARDVLGQVEEQVRAAKAAAEEKAKREQQTRDEIARAKASRGQMDDTGPTSREAKPDVIPAAFLGTTHTVSYSYCRLCSEYGHTARTCPLKAYSSAKR